MNDTLPYKATYSNGDETCVKCRKIIQGGNLQLGIMMQSHEDDCRYVDWYHRRCFSETRMPSTEAAFEGFPLLRYDQQVKIKEMLGTMDNDHITVPIAKLPDFSIEYKKKKDSSKCIACNQMIPINSIRIMKVVFDLNQNTAFDGTATWYHDTCFSRQRLEIGWLRSAESLPGYKRLSNEDKAMLLNLIPTIKRDIIDLTKEDQTETSIHELEKEIMCQNKEYFEIFDQLEKVSIEHQEEILTENIQFLPENAHEIRHHLTDVIYFGALQLCEKCEIGLMMFSHSSYICTRENTWGRCDNVVKIPKRNPTILPRSIVTEYPFLKANETVKTRAIHAFKWTDEKGNDLVYGKYEHPKFFNMKFAIVGNLSKPHKEIERTIVKMGGQVRRLISKNLAAIISNREEVEKRKNDMAYQMKEAKKYNIHIVSEDILTAVETIDPILYIQNYKICAWGGDPKERIVQHDVKSRRETTFYTSNLPTVKKYCLKNGTVADPESDLTQTAHIYCGNALNSRNVAYSVVLGLVDIENDKNSYYRLQLYESDDKKQYSIFESWGRISTVIGKKSIRHFDSLDLALDEFKSIYKNKTGNNFGVKAFKKCPEKFYHLDIDFGIVREKPKAVIESKLNVKVRELMEMMFDIRHMEKMMVACEIDIKQMPLGKIGEKQIKTAMNALSNISKLISKNGTSIGELRSASNRFYTLIPHSFGIERPKIIDSTEIVQEKFELLESLLNMQLIYGFMNEESGETINPLDACFDKLKATIVPLDNTSETFQQLQKIARDTHGPTHTLYKLELLDVFEVTRESEQGPSRFNVIDRHRLLWHGSRLMNYVSIITNGLKIAPPEAQHTGTMFNKGIYFADIISKSANYCNTNYQDNIGLMMLCEVALGASRPMTHADKKLTGIPNAKEQSVKAYGTYYPASFCYLDGVKVKTGSICSAKAQPLFYNEYVIYDPSQIRIKYICKMKFNYN